ncbi:pyocin knob domain-containing protein [Pantoea agglomerans]|uniref:pyocin knob domain-containing protein n=1 Tax=Enterobacter agglomerans TaxID=549 RepID=UPI001F5F1832|nr:pyocin knob domain-containing protein [Pantoea agglomerans]
MQLSTVNSVSVPTAILTGTDINTLGFASEPARAALYAQPKNANATPALNYPEKTAGTLHVMPSAYGCQQMYVTFTSNTWNRGLSADWNGVDGPWKEWVPTYGTNNKPTAADVGALASTGGVVTGEIKGTSAVFSGSLTQRENTVGYRQLISRADAFSAYTTYNRLDQVEGVQPSSVNAVGDINARLTTAAGDT